MQTLALRLPIALLAICAGCTSDTISISGNVSYDGLPMKEGTIEFIPVEGTVGPSTGSSIRAGRYECSRVNRAVPGGRYQVRITALAKTGQTTPNVLQPGGPPLELSDNYVPAIYNRNSNLKIILSSDSTNNVFDFQLQSKSQK